MIEKLLIAGFGGQGVMFLGKVLAHAGMVAGRYVTWIPSYGPEMRGGTANCSVIIADSEIGEPVVNHPHILVAMNAPSLAKFLPSVAAGGTVLVNSSLIHEVPAHRNVTILPIPANDLARQVGQTAGANMVMLGVLLQRLRTIDKAAVVTAMEESIPAHRHHLITANLAAIAAGEAAAGALAGSY